MSSPSLSSSGSASDSGHGSPDSSSVDSPPISFGHPLDSNDPLSFFLDSGAVTIRESMGESSTDDSMASTTPSSHDSPTGDWHTSDSAPTKEPTNVWHQHELSLFSLDNFNPPGHADFPLGFDPMLFSNDPLISMNSTSAVPADLSSFSFNFGTESAANLNVSNTDTSDRRSSITSSSSRLPFSPITDQGASVSTSGLTAPGQLPSVPQASSANDQLMNELATRAKQLVGLTMALPFGENPAPSDNRQSQQQQSQQQLCVPTASPVSDMSVPSEYASPTNSGSASPVPSSRTTTARTKTSHTTIERRYRTNLNARIQGLRAAVPALRVLEVKQGNRVGNLALRAGTRRVGVDADAQAGQEDVIDERGYIDGVKVARKGSKANVLGKAVEYIHVLKRREMRLKREQEGLKALIRSLVGGPELVQQWEKMWRERFGGPEKDEIDADEAEADDENDDGEDDDDMEDKELDGASTAAGRKRKRAKVDPLVPAKSREKVSQFEPLNYPQTMQPVAIMPSQPFSNSSSNLPMSVPPQPEKRKRGRPRKVPLPPVATSNGVVQNSLETPFGSHLFQQQQQSPTAPVSGMKMEVDAAKLVQGELHSALQSRQQSGHQYLLAAFAFFSFFNSPMSYSSGSTWEPSSHTTYSGSVVGDGHPEVIVTEWDGAGASKLGFDWRDVVHITHLVVSILLLLSIAAPWFPRLAKHMPRALNALIEPGNSQISATSSSNETVDEEEKTDTMIRMDLLSALSKSRSLSLVEEAQVLREALGLGSGVLSMILSLVRQIRLSSKSRSRYRLERRMLEQKAFSRLAGLVALDANASVAIRIQIYLYAFRFLSVGSASVEDLTTFALVVRPFWRSKSASLWTLARVRAQGQDTTSLHICKPYEVYVLQSMTVDEASRNVAGDPGISVLDCTKDSQCDDGVDYCPLAVLAKRSIREFIRSHAENVFVQSVTGDACEADGSVDERDFDRVVDAGRSLDSRTANIVDTYERVCGPSGTGPASDVRLDHELESENNSKELDSTDEEILSLLRAILLYRRIFPSAVLNGNVACTNLPVDCRAGGSGPSNSFSLNPMPSPPPSPSRRDAALHLALRHCLDSSAFDRKDVLEDARDRVVDMLTAESSAWPRRLKYSI